MRAAVPGDTYRNLRIHPDYSNRTFNVLVPVWVLSMRLRRRAFQVVVNGYTARLPVSEERLENPGCSWLLWSWRLSCLG